MTAASSFPGAPPTSVPGQPRPPPPPTTASSARGRGRAAAPVPDPEQTQRARVQMVQHTVERAGGVVYLRSGPGTGASSKHGGEPSPSSRSRAAGPNSSSRWCLPPQYYYYTAPVVLAGIAIVASNASTASTSTSTSTSTKSHALIAIMVPLTGNYTPALEPATWALVGALVVIMWLLGGGVQHQSLTPLPGLGIQLATTRRVMYFGTSTQRLFVPLEDISTVVIHERLARWSAEYYLAIVRKGGDVVVAFDQVRPRLDVLRKVYHATREALWDEYDDSSDTPHNGHAQTTATTTAPTPTMTLHR